MNITLKVIFIVLMMLATWMCLVLGSDPHSKNILTLFFIVILFNAYVYLTSRGDLLNFFLPSVVCVNYVYISMIFGGWAFISDNVVLDAMITGAEQWTDSLLPTLFIALVACTVILVADYHKKEIAWRIPEPAYLTIIILGASIFLIGYLVAPLHTGFTNQIISAPFFLYVLYVAALPHRTTRILLYLIVLVPLVLIFAHDKRDAIFPILPILFLELINSGRLQLNLKQIIMVLMLIPVVGAMILVATVLRTPEVFGIDSIFDIYAAMLEYVSFDDFLGNYLLDLEFTYTYFHSMNAINYAFTDQIPALLGATYVKPLFILIPRELVEWKPFSAVHYYTIYEDPEYRLAGGSWAVSMIAEAALNFRMFGVVVCAFVLRVLDGIFVRFVLIRTTKNFLFSVAALYFFVSYMNFARGSGLSLSLVLFLAVVFATIPFLFVLRFGKNSRILRRISRRTSTEMVALSDQPAFKWKTGRL